MSVVHLTFTERLDLNPERVRLLYRRFGAHEAEEMICRTFERISTALARIEFSYLAGDMSSLKTFLVELHNDAISSGLLELGQLVSNTLECLSISDKSALAATLWRLGRLSETLLGSETFTDVHKLHRDHQ